MHRNITVVTLLVIIMGLGPIIPLHYSIPGNEAVEPAGGFYVRTTAPLIKHVLTMNMFVGSDYVKVLGWIKDRNLLVVYRGGFHPALLFLNASFYSVETINLTGYSRLDYLPINGFYCVWSSNGSRIYLLMQASRNETIEWRLYRLSLENPVPVINKTLSNILSRLSTIQAVYYVEDRDRLLVVYNNEYVAVISGDGTLIAVRNTGIILHVEMIDNLLYVLTAENRIIAVNSNAHVVINKTFHIQACSRYSFYRNSIAFLKGHGLFGLVNCRDKSYYLLYNISTGRLILKQGVGDIIYHISIAPSPDGRYVALSYIYYTHYTQTILQLLDVKSLEKGGGNYTLWNIGGFKLGALIGSLYKGVRSEKPVWSPDERFILFSSPVLVVGRDGVIYGVGDSSSLFDLYASWSPDMEYIVETYHLVNNTYRIIVYNASTITNPQYGYVEIRPHDDYYKDIIVVNKVKGRGYIIKFTRPIVGQPILPLYIEPGNYTIMYAPRNVVGPIEKIYAVNIRVSPGKSICIDIPSDKLNISRLLIYSKLPVPINITFYWKTDLTKYKIYKLNDYAVTIRNYTQIILSPKYGKLVRIVPGDYVLEIREPGNYSFQVKLHVPYGVKKLVIRVNRSTMPEQVNKTLEEKLKPKEEESSEITEYELKMAEREAWETLVKPVILISLIILIVGSILLLAIRSL